jgi:hypothetical protein
VSSGDECVPRRYAERNWYYSDNQEQWFASREDSGDDDSDDDRDDGESLYGYGTNIMRIHGWPGQVAKESLCFGVELEMEPDGEHSQADVIHALGGRDGDGRYILAHDGSLSDGVEAITLPYPLEYHQKNSLWDVICKPARKVAQSGSGTHNCGIHVHINRKALSPLTVGKMLVFVNSPKTQHLITTIAQRTGESWARRSAKKFTDGRELSSEHYDAMGLTGKGTCELRIFRGNLRKERVLKAIEFAHALVRYCQASSLLDVENPREFVSFIRAQKHHYPNLVAFIAEKRGYSDKAAANACRDNEETEA